MRSLGIAVFALVLSPLAASAQTPSPAPAAKGPTLTPAEIEAKEESSIRVSYSTFEGPLTDTQKTTYRRLDKLHKDCKARVNEVLDKSGAIPADQLDTVLATIKDASDRCMREGILKDSMLKSVRAEADFKIGGATPGATDDGGGGGGRRR